MKTCYAPIVCPATIDYLGYQSACSLMPDSIKKLHILTILTEAVYDTYKLYMSTNET